MIRTVQELLVHLYSKGKRRDIVSIDVLATLQEAATLMDSQGINLLAITEAEGKLTKFVGVLSSSDTSKALGRSGSKTSKKLVSNVMTPIEKVVTAGLEDQVNDLIKSLVFKGVRKIQYIRHLIVVGDDNVWCAVLDTNEVLDAVMANIDEEEQREAQIQSEFRT